MTLRKNVIAIVLGIICSGGFAHGETLDIMGMVGPGNKIISDVFQRFQPHKMNYAIYQSTSGDENAIEVQYSLRYDLLNMERKNNQNLYLCYTGVFDFYVGTRESGPVINRTSNLGAHYRINKDISPIMESWADIGVEHKSDGQVVDAKSKETNASSPNFGQYLTQVEYLKHNHAYFDGISVGMNYVNFIGGIKYKKIMGEMEVKSYFTNDSDVTWGPYAMSGRKFSDYDLIRLSGKYEQDLGSGWFKSLIAGFDYTIGKMGLATDSIDLYLSLPLEPGEAWKIPFFVKMHLGPMDRLSNFTQSTRSIGIGLALNIN